MAFEFTDTNFQSTALDNDGLTVIDFWAEWCSHCKTLTPMLEKLAAEFNGKFLLAKINADEQQMIAGQLGVRSLPTVMIFQNGQPVDGFAGAQPETEVRKLLEKYLPEPWREDFAAAQGLIAEGKLAEALELLRKAYSESAQVAEVAQLLTHCLLELNRLDEAETILAAVKVVDQDDDYKSLLAKLELLRESAKSPEIEALEQQLAQTPDDLHIQLQLAVQYNQSSQSAEALELLIAILRKDLNYGDGEAKKFFLDILATLGKSDPLAIKYQRKYYTLLY